MKWALDGEADLGQVGNFNFGILEQSIRSWNIPQIRDIINLVKELGTKGKVNA